MNLHFLQSDDWAKFQESEGFKVVKKSDKDFAIMAIKKTTPLGDYLFVPYGPSLNDKKALKPAIDSIIELANEEKCIFARVEPTLRFSEEEMAKIGAKRTSHYDPEYTWALDLTQSEEDILKDIEKTKVRAYRNRESKGVSIRTSKDPADMDIFFKFYETVAKNDSFQTNEYNYLKNQLNHDFATLYIAEYTNPEDENVKKEPIAATIMYSDQDTSYYAYAGADYEHRKLKAGAILLIQMILDAKAAGKKVFDFWGITISDDPSDPWYGFTEFKKSFGGYQISYTGTYDIPIDRKKYKLYTMLRPINKIKQKIVKK